MTRSSDLRNFYRADDGTVVAANIPKGKIAYSNGGRIIGTQDVLVADMFHDTAGTLLTDHVPVVNVHGHPYENRPFASPYDGGVFILGATRYAYQTGNSHITHGPIETEISDVLINSQVQMCTQNTYGSQGIVFRYVDDDNYWVWARDSSTVAKLSEYVAGTPTHHASPAVTLTSSARYNFTVRCVGEEITCYVDGVERTSYTSSGHVTATKHGIYGIGFTAPGPSYHLDLLIQDLS